MAASECILLAVDFSPASETALRRTAKLAARLQTKVVLVHAFTPPPRVPTLAATVHDGPYVPILAAEAQMQREEAHELTMRWAQPLRELGLDADVVAQPGPATDLILETAEKYNPEMIIMGRQGQSRVRRMIVGSQSKYIAQHSAWPVLLVPM